jgi:RNA polymerase sigma-70 factor (ECF subfamily)
MTDQQIIRGLRKNDEAAFRELVDQYQELVINVSNKFIHNKEDALDIAQEVFIKVYNSIDSFREDSKISTWLYRIAVNKSLNFIRDKKRKNIFSSLDLLFENSKNDPLENMKDIQDNSEDKIESEEEKDMLYKAIETLPEKQRVALTLNKLEGLSYKEISNIMNISLSETGVLINRAKNKLQKKLIAYFKNN